MGGPFARRDDNGISDDLAFASGQIGAMNLPAG